jgi:hypothetical protein
MHIDILRLIKFEKVFESYDYYLGELGLGRGRLVTLDRVVQAARDRAALLACGLRAHARKWK